MKRIAIIGCLVLWSVSGRAQVEADTTTDCFDSFFASGSKVSNPSKVFVAPKNRKTVTLSTFIKQNSGMDGRTMLKDLDGDGKKELVVFNFTGGAHCCDEFYFFKNTGVNRYQQVNKLFAGQTCVDRDTFYFSFIEPFGYFFTCYACALTDEEDAPKGLEYVYSVPLVFTKGKLKIVPGTVELRQKIENNLSLISKLKWDGGIKDAEFDDGRRKEVALNLVTWYYSFGRNINETKALFFKYYKFRDANKVWTEFFQTLRHIQATNDF